jgi:hypothetical protein
MAKDVVVSNPNIVTTVVLSGECEYKLEILRERFQTIYNQFKKKNFFTLKLIL